MSHTYATVQELKKYIAEDSDTDTASWTDSDSTLLTLLEGASRRVERYCMRSDFGSGFGPRIASNRYDADGSDTLDLRDDFQGFSSISLIQGPGGGTVSLTLDTDIYATPYGGPPYTGLVFTNLGQAPSFGLRLWTVAGTAGYSYETASLGTAAIASSGATSITLTSGTAYAGTTLLVGSEHLYVTASSGGTALTVLRAQNGTTAAAGTAAASVFRYPREVVTATLAIAARRNRSAQAGVQGDFGGGTLPIVGNRDTETSILRGTVAHLRRYAAG